MQIKIGRIFNTYGPQMLPNDGRVVSNFIIQALQDKPLTIYGDGSQTRSFCYVDDLIDAFIRFMGTEEKLTGPLNLGNPSEFTISELAESVINLTNSKSELIFLKLPMDDPKQRQPDLSKTSKTLDWYPQTALYDGLLKTIPYFANSLRQGIDKEVWRPI